MQTKTKEQTLTCACCHQQYPLREIVETIFRGVKHTLCIWCAADQERKGNGKQTA